MAIFTQQSAARKETAPFIPDASQAPANHASPAAEPAPQRSTQAWPAERTDAKESLIASDITIEGKIEGAGHVRIAGRFKGDVNVQGDLTIEKGAKLNGGVRAKKVILAGELEGNIDAAAQVELQQGGVLIGDLKAGSLTVAAGSRMRGQVEFGWEGVDGKSARNGAERVAAS